MKRPMPLDTRYFPRLTSSMSLREVGAYVLLGLYFWRHGRVPDDQASAARILGIPGARAAATVARLKPHFDHGEYLPILREAHLMKVARRARIARVSNATRWKTRGEAGRAKS